MSPLRSSVRPPFRMVVQGCDHTERRSLTRHPYETLLTYGHPSFRLDLFCGICSFSCKPFPMLRMMHYVLIYHLVHQTICEKE